MENEAYMQRVRNHDIEISCPGKDNPKCSTCNHYTNNDLVHTGNMNYKNAPLFVHGNVILDERGLQKLLDGKIKSIEGIRIPDCPESHNMTANGEDLYFDNKFVIPPVFGVIMPVDEHFYKSALKAIKENDGNKLPRPPPRYAFAKVYSLVEKE